MNRPIYLDYQATTPVDPRVLEVMLPWFTERFGNAASRHAYGQQAEDAVEAARAQVARLIGAKPEDVVFTSGATESNNLAIKGTAALHAGPGHLVTVQTEHRAVLDPCRALERQGWRVTCLPVGADGLVDPEAVEAALADDTVLVSVMAANNEVGVLQPVAGIGAITKAKGVLFHCDAAQAAGKEALDAAAMGVDLLSLSAHKLYGPKGIGALYVRRSRPRVRLMPILDGGGHERGFRPGTLNVPGIVGFGKAAELCLAEMGAERARLAGLRDRLKAGIEAGLDGVRLNGHPARRLAGNLNLSFAGVDGEALLAGLTGLAVSSGSACTSASLEPSHVLKALGVPDGLARASIRFGLGRFTTADEVDEAARQVVAHVLALRRKTAAPVSQEALR